MYSRYRLACCNLSSQHWLDFFAKRSLLYKFFFSQQLTWPSASAVPSSCPLPMPGKGTVTITILERNKLREFTVLLEWSIVTVTVTITKRNVSNNIIYWRCSVKIHYIEKQDIKPHDHRYEDVHYFCYCSVKEDYLREDNHRDDQHDIKLRE